MSPHCTSASVSAVDRTGHYMILGTVSIKIGLAEICVNVMRHGVRWPLGVTVSQDDRHRLEPEILKFWLLSAAADWAALREEDPATLLTAQS